MEDEIKKILGMTADTVGKDLLAALVQEINLLPDVWVKLSEAKQQDIIDRLAKRVTANVQTAVHIIQGQGRIVVQGELEQVAIKDGVKANISFSKAAENIRYLYWSAGMPVLVVVGNPNDYTQGMDEVKPMPDQRGFGEFEADAGVVDGDTKLIEG